MFFCFGFVLFFFSRSNFRAITRLETRATQSTRFFKKIHLHGGVGIARVAAGLLTRDPDRALKISPSGVRLAETQATLYVGILHLLSLLSETVIFHS